ncbi:hypothetical protein GGI42DRAFT_297915 [Trichoderma sp. SZMC 28013]
MPKILLYCKHHPTLCCSTPGQCRYPPAIDNTYLLPSPSGEASGHEEGACGRGGDFILLLFELAPSQPMMYTHFNTHREAYSNAMPLALISNAFWGRIRSCLVRFSVCSGMVTLDNATWSSRPTKPYKPASRSIEKPTRHLRRKVLCHGIVQKATFMHDMASGGQLFPAADS